LVDVLTARGGNLQWPLQITSIEHRSNTHRREKFPRSRERRAAGDVVVSGAAVRTERRGVISLRRGNNSAVEETTSPAPVPDEGPGVAGAEPAVTAVLDGDTARLTLTGELTEAARRPLVRVLTDLLLQEHAPARVVLDLRGVSFMNSAGMAVLVQLERMGAPRRVEVALQDPPEGVLRPLQLSGLWRRFPVLDSSRGGVVPAPEDGAS
jgi:anti-anti-sigma factor